MKNERLKDFTIATFIVLTFTVGLCLIVYMLLGYWLLGDWRIIKPRMPLLEVIGITSALAISIIGISTLILRKYYEPLIAKEKIPDKKEKTEDKMKFEKINNTAIFFLLFSFYSAFVAISDLMFCHNPLLVQVPRIHANDLPWLMAEGIALVTVFTVATLFTIKAFLK